MAEQILTFIRLEHLHAAQPLALLHPLPELLHIGGGEHPVEWSGSLERVNVAFAIQ
ncbi:MAG: hypothetical protein BWY82_02632 [Verrucomicrobia bacterium ADurb.Bin474]|nr:MAG: hypothetical protein BWY82_02632 [Verrucomicrobia bacterium ADurb.Bin474]